MTNLQSFTNMFRDRHIAVKLGETAVFALLLPVPVMGLLCLCALLGYLAEIAHNVGNDYPRPLPEWDHIGEDISKGFPVLVALVVYHLPLLLALILLFGFRDAIAISLFGGITFAGLASFALPLMGVYLLFAWSCFAVALALYAETWESEHFYQFSALLRVMQMHGALILQWLIASLAASLVLLLLVPVALLGLFLFVPVQGWILGRCLLRLRLSRMAFLHGPAASEPLQPTPGLSFAPGDGPAALPSSEPL